MNQLYRATILPVPEAEPRPLWSVMIPTYNCANYLRRTLTSVLQQDPGSEIMQIEVVDDRSTKDDPQTVVAELGKGRVGFYQQPHNVGHTKNFETCLQRSRGKLIHLLHGDDCVGNGFYRQMEAAFAQNSEIGAAFCRHIFIDDGDKEQSVSPLLEAESGVLSNWLERIAVTQHIQTPSIAVRRDVYEKLGGFDRRLSWAEDWEMWVRIAANYPVWFEVEPLALYRMHSVSNSGRYIQTGENVKDLRRAIKLIESHLPQESASQLSKTALKNYASYALNCARELSASGQTWAMNNQIKQALICSSSLDTIREAIKLILRAYYLKIKAAGF